MSEFSRQQLGSLIVVDCVLRLFDNGTIKQRIRITISHYGVGLSLDSLIHWPTLNLSQILHKFMPGAVSEQRGYNVVMGNTSYYGGGMNVAPGADPAQIRIRYDGIDSLRVNDAGDLLIETAFGTLRDNAPLAWQEIDAERVNRPARFEALDRFTYRFGVDGRVDADRTLIIDPEIEWMTYLGGSGSEWGYGVAADSAGNALVSGITSSTNFEGRNNSYFGGLYDAFALKVSPSGTLQWMSYLGGSNDDRGRDIAVDGGGNALVTGSTPSTDFAGRNNSYHGGRDAFVVKVGPAGQLAWMTYLGGSLNDFGRGIAVDSAGNALVAGETLSIDFEGRNNWHHGGLEDAFLVKLRLADCPGDLNGDGRTDLADLGILLADFGCTGGG
ncbi:hypothetical protein LCGC14_2487010, partial [marine sediment metagenome]